MHGVIKKKNQEIQQQKIQEKISDHNKLHKNLRTKPLSTSRNDIADIPLLIHKTPIKNWILCFPWGPTFIVLVFEHFLIWLVQICRFVFWMTNQFSVVLAAANLGNWFVTLNQLAPLLMFKQSQSCRTSWINWDMCPVSDAECGITFLMSHPICQDSHRCYRVHALW